MTRCIALIRAINVGASRKVPMAEPRAACAEAGLPVAATSIQSGNIVLDVPVDGVEARLATTDPNLVLAGFAKRPADAGGIAALAAKGWPGVRLAAWQDGFVACYDSREPMRDSRLSTRRRGAR